MRGHKGAGVRFFTGKTVVSSIVLAAVCAGLAGCANENKSGGDPGAKPLPAGMTCPSLKQEMDRLVSRGVQGLIEGRQAGRKLTPAQNADADRYNELLNYYLGARCYT